MNTKYDFLRITAVSNILKIGNIEYNTNEIKRIISENKDSDVILFPELSITGYTCGDLYSQQSFLNKALEGVNEIAWSVGNQLVAVGFPYRHYGATYNCAAILNNRKIVGIVPKSYLPTYKEFYEKRWFQSPINHNISNISENAVEGYMKKHNLHSHSTKDYKIPFGTDLLFQFKNVSVGVEICEDVWMPIPPSCYQAIAGATVLLNLSSSNETIGKSEYRTALVENQSGRCVAAYVYASSGPTESSTDIVMGGHCLIAENSHIVAESPRVGDIENGIKDRKKSHTITTDIDIEKLLTERASSTSFGDAKEKENFRRVPISLIDNNEEPTEILRKIDPMPFVPSDPETLKHRCADIFGIQCHGLAQRIEQLPKDTPLVIGVSGGLDSTLALLVAVKTLKMIDQPLSRIIGITMPGFGTTDKTYQNSLDIMTNLGITQKEISIAGGSFQMFKDIGHSPFGIDITEMDLDEFKESLSNLTKKQRSKGDLIFENVQARQRTAILMAHGFVLGTGDLSELLIGWCTYNGDHMSMYNVNASIPKTLVKFLVGYVRDNETNDYLKKRLDIVINTEISPELLPPDEDGEIEQSTEDSVGSYDLIDFFGANFLKSWFSPQKIFLLAVHSDHGKRFSKQEIKDALLLFFKMFIKNQFKRSCVPDAPKVGSVSLSPRGDLRFPSDMDSEFLIKNIESISVE